MQRRWRLQVNDGFVKNPSAALSLRLLRSTYYKKYASLEALFRLASGAFYFAVENFNSSEVVSE